MVINRRSNSWLSSAAEIALNMGCKVEILEAPRNPQRDNVPDVSEAAWLSFVDHFERFTDVLCAAARLGCSEEHEREYSQLRQWFARNYGAVAHRLRPSLDLIAPYDEDLGDVLELMFRPALLDDLLRQDRGDLIPCIATISECVYAVPLP